MPQAPRRVADKVYARGRRNVDFAWDTFDSAWYHEYNYGRLRWDDREIIEHVRDFFAEAYKRGRLGTGLHGVDVGSGANLYPSLSMLPFCKTISLLDFSDSNIEWLKKQVREYGPSWDPFWETLTESDLYDLPGGPRTRLRDAARIEKNNIFKLPRARWDVGTMFFGAESLTSDLEEFHRALLKFVHGLKPRAPFAAAFMRGSQGYRVASEWFPAVAIDEDHVEKYLTPATTGLRLHKVALEERLRSGYDGMILAMGYRSNQ